MKSSGNSKRTFCYIADALAAFFLILLRGNEGEAYNVCNTDAFCSIAELADTLVGLYPELHLKVVRKEREKDDAYVENSVASGIPYDNAKLKRLGWETKYDIQAGFSRVIEAIRFGKEAAGRKAAAQEEERDERGDGYADNQHSNTHI